jgi:hypothetical protein
MDVAAVYEELFSRVHDHVRGAVEGLDPADLAVAPEPGSNPLGWLLWHLTRVQDMHVAELVDRPQVWETDDWPARFGLEPDPGNVGYGHTPEQVAQVQPRDVEVILGYYAAVEAQTSGLVRSLTPEMLDRVVDVRWDPPVTMGVRLVSIVDDCIQHAGQAAYVKGLLERR